MPGLNKEISGGEIIYKDKKIGTHKGYPYYTIGQARIKCCSREENLCFEIDAENNRVYTDDEENLYNTEFSVKN